VGAGPAGATAAKTLGEAGISTLILDKSDFPRDKPCGGGISARVVRRFPYLEAALAGIPTKWLSKVYFESPDGTAVSYESPERLYLMIRRLEFDHLLLSLARGHVEFHSRALVRNITDDGGGAIVTADVAGDQRQYTCRMVLGCDGANSVVARFSRLRSGGIQNEYAIDMMEETPGHELASSDSDRMYIYYRIQGQYGYGYVFPKARHLNLGVGFKLDYYLSELRGRQYSYHQAFVEELTSKGVVAGKSNRANFRAFPLPIGGPLRRASTDRVLLAGDAGGFVNAFTAEGIYYAMVSGELAARSAIEAAKADRFDRDQLERYDWAWKREIGAELRKSVHIQRRLLADPGRVDRLVLAASRNPALADLLARYATGASSYAEFKRDLLARAFPIYVREKWKALLA
jgi:geranylgeranyl reductase family protein